MHRYCRENKGKSGERENSPGPYEYGSLQVEAVLGHDGTRRLVRFPNFRVDAEWLKLQRRIFDEHCGVNTFGSDDDMTSDADADAAYGQSWSDEDMQAAPAYELLSIGVGSACTHGSSCMLVCRLVS